MRTSDWGRTCTVDTDGSALLIVRQAVPFPVPALPGYPILAESAYSGEREKQGRNSYDGGRKVTPNVLALVCPSPLVPFSRKLSAD